MMRRREVITLVGGAAAWPASVHAQGSAMPAIGILHTQSSDVFADELRVFRQGLRESGYVEGETVAIEYRWAENQIHRLPALAAELVRRQVVAIAALGGLPAALAAKAATATIPTVFIVAEDPVRLGLVASLSRPGGNLTGINFFAGELTAKRLELLRELVPTATRIAMLVNLASAENESTVKDIEAAARAKGLQIQVVSASTDREINAAFATFVRERPDALLVAPGNPFNGRRVQLVQLAAFHRIPAIYAQRQNVRIGGLMSYGASLTDAYRQVGAYIGRILKGSSPADLPVVQSSKFELVISAETARMLGLTVPPTLLALADEVIE